MVYTDIVDLYVVNLYVVTYVDTYVVDMYFYHAWYMNHEDSVIMNYMCIVNTRTIVLYNSE